MKIAIVSLVVIVSASVRPVIAVSVYKTGHLFFIESNNSKDVVRYDVQMAGNNDLCEPNPVVVYWALQNGRQKGLNLIERKFAYGISSQKKLGKNRFVILMATLKDRNIIVRRINGSYKAVFSIGGKYSILEKVHVNSKNNSIGFPKVLYFDLFGRDVKTNCSIKERIFPDNGS